MYCPIWKDVPHNSSSDDDDDDDYDDDCDDVSYRGSNAKEADACCTHSFVKYN